MSRLCFVPQRVDCPGIAGIAQLKSPGCGLNALPVPAMLPAMLPVVLCPPTNYASLAGFSGLGLAALP
jgi:hypothetical protein